MTMGTTGSPGSDLPITTQDIAHHLETAMASSDFLPDRQTELRAWSQNFSQKISDSPAAYGLTAQQAADYAALNDAYAQALQVAMRSSTRTTPAITAKKDAMKALKAKARELARIIRANPAVTSFQRASLRLSLYKPDDRSPRVARPQDSPEVILSNADGFSVKVHLRERDGYHRRKPHGVQGAAIFTAVGTAPPASLRDWQFHGMTTRTKLRITFSGKESPGSRIWITAQWINPRLQRGPASRPVCTNLPGGMLNSIHKQHSLVA